MMILVCIKEMLATHETPCDEGYAMIHPVYHNTFSRKKIMILFGLMSPKIIKTQ